MIFYYELGAEKRLNEIVIAGSHDSGITQGGGNAMTQKLDILGQALAGVRIFDLRVAGTARGRKDVELKTYHGPLSKSKVRKNVVGLQGKQKVIQSSVTGTFGEGLVEILGDARSFVTTYPSEFLILKFDKCKNWQQIAELAVQELGTTLYTGSGNLNRKTLLDLKGKVIVVATEGGLAAIDPQYRGLGGILGIKNLFAGGVYEKDFNGMQYWGKGGTDMTTRGAGRSIQENYDKQLKLMQGGASGNPNVMGMMYWTTTGIVGDIRKRNKKMWESKNIGGLSDLWLSGMGDAVKVRIPACVDPASYAGGPVLKRFLPNVVMIDFASSHKCQTIYDLNQIVPTELTKMEQLMIAIKKHVN